MTLQHYEVGLKNQTTIIFLHGIGTSGWVWKAPVEQLAKYHCIIPDLPEHRGSLDKGPFSISHAVEQVAQLIRKKAHGGRAYVVGAGLGGQIALQLLWTEPELVEGVVVSGVVVNALKKAKWQLILSKLYMPVRHYEFLLRTNMKRLGIPKKYFEDFRRDTLLLDSDSFTRIFEENFSFRMPDSVSKQHPPLLFMIGKKDPAIIHKSFTQLCLNYPQATGIVVDGAKHNWPLEKPALFSKTISAWIDKKPLPKKMMIFSKKTELQ